MKKLFTLFAVTAFALSMTACGGNSNSNKNTESTETQTEAAAEVAAPAAEEGNVLDKYEKLVNQAIEVYPKVKAGDAAATQEYMKIAEEMSKMAEELTTEMANMTPEQVQRFSELGQKWAAAAAQ